ncbi:hypothetical protein ACGFIY_33475 [Micromonospora chersina]|uniref:hypothetical protein n=1 Tax=Micromonospora chersina TaxID=47854 RepID=UPI0037165DC1
MRVEVCKVQVSLPLLGKKTWVNVVVQNLSTAKAFHLNSVTVKASEAVDDIIQVCVGQGGKGAWLLPTEEFRCSGNSLKPIEAVAAGIINYNTSNGTIVVWPVRNSKVA